MAKIKRDESPENTEADVDIFKEEETDGTNNSEVKKEAEEKKKPVIARRRKRIPLHDRQILVSDKRKGYRRRFVNDIENRIQNFMNAGYTIVNHEDMNTGYVKVGQASQLGNAVIRPVGGGMNAVLMEIPNEFYEEDQKAKQKRVSELEESAFIADAENRDLDIKKAEIIRQQ